MRPIKEIRSKRSRKSKSERVSRDIKKRGEIKNTLQELKDLYRAVMENTQVGFTLIDLNHNIIMVNSMICEYFHKSIPELIGRKCFREFEKRDSICIHCPGKKAIATGMPAVAKTEGVRDDGSHFQVSIQAFPTTSSDGKVTGFIEIVQDITEQKKALTDLKKSKDLLEKTFLSLDSAIFILDNNDPPIILNCNPAATKIFGYTENEFLGRTTEFLHVNKETLLEFQRILHPTIKKQDHLSFFEFRMKRKNGQTFPTEHFVRSLKDEHGKRIGWISVIRDIKERKQAEETLRESEDKYRAIFEQAADSIVLFDAKTGRMIDFNNKAHEKLGYSREEFQKLRLTDIDAIESDEEVNKRVEMIISKGMDRFETQQKTKSGEIRDILVNAKVLPINSRNIIQAIWSDITEIKRQSEELRLHSEIMGNMIEGIILTRVKDATIVYANPKFEDMFGYAPGEIIGKNISIINAPIDKTPKAIAEDIQKCLSKNGTWHGEIFNVRKDGTTFWSYANVSVFHHADYGKVWVATHTDITERKQAEEKLIRLNKMMKMLTSISQDVFQIKDRLELLKKICERIVEYAYKLVWIGFCDERTKKVIPEAQAGFEDGYLDSIKITCDESKYGKGPTGIAIKTGRPKVMRFIAKNDRYKPWRKEALNRGYRSSAAIPIFTGEKVIGALNVYADKEDAFSNEEIKLLDELAHNISIGLRGIDEEIRRKQAEKKLLDHRARLKSLTSELTLTEERERRHIAVELHDQIAQSLVISKIKLDSLNSSAQSRGFNKELSEISDSLSRIIQDIRSLTFDLSYPILYELGFEEAVAAWLVEQIQEKYDIATEFQDDKQPKPMDKDVCVLLFRAVRELLINVVKHANASKVKVSIRRIDSRIQVNVEDDGIGFDVDKVVLSSAKNGGGFGFFSIRERLEDLAGILKINSKPGHGTKVTLIAPLTEQNTKGKQE